MLACLLCARGQVPCSTVVLADKLASAGSTGKTTTSWLIRGIFDELDKSAGLIGTVEYGIDEFLMTEDGDLWKRDEPDPTLQR